MKIPHLRMIAISLLILSSFISCSSNDDNSGKDDFDSQKTIQVFRMQMVTLELSSALTQENYSGTIGDRTLNLNKLSNNKLLLIIPEDLPLGKTTLEIKELKFRQKYEIDEMSSNSSKEIILDDFIVKLEYQIDQTDSPTVHEVLAKNLIRQFKENYGNLSSEEQSTLAKFIEANNDFLFNFELPKGNASDFNNQEHYLAYSSFTSRLDSFKMNVLAIGAGALLLKAAALSPIVVVAAVVIIGVAIYKAYQDHSEFCDAMLNKALQPFSNRPLQLNTSSNEGIIFNSNKESFLNLKIKSRQLIESDIASNNENIQTFFTYHNLLKEKINNFNEVVDWIKQNTFYSSASTVENATLNKNPITEVEYPTMEEFSNMSFEIADKRVTLISSSYQSGQISLTLRADDTNAISESQINTSLQIHYTDDFNSISQTLPIILNLEEEFELSGNWKFTEIDESPDDPVNVSVLFSTNDMGIGINSSLGKIRITYENNKLSLHINNEEEDINETITFDVSNPRDTVFETIIYGEIWEGGVNGEDDIFVGTYPILIKLERL